MSRVVYDFLNDSVLLDEGEVEREYPDVSEARLLQELEAYRKHILSHLTDIIEAMAAPARGPKAYVGAAGEAAVDRVLLRRMVLYFDRAIIDDPLFRLTCRPSADHEAFTQFFGYEAEGPLNRRRLANVATFLRRVRPLVGHDFLCIVPISLTSEPPSKLGLSYSPTLYAERVPDDIREWMHKRARVFPLQKLDRGWGFEQGAVLKPCRAIVIELAGFAHPMVFHLTQTRFESHEEDPNRFTMTQTLSDTPPSQAQFDAWITQSLNQFAGHVFERVATDVVHSVYSHAMLLTDSPLIDDLLSLRADGPSVEEDIARLALNLALPSVDGASEADLMHVRVDHGASFERFRIDLQRGLLDISGETNRGRQHRMLDELRHQFEELQIREMHLALADLRSGLLANAAVGALSLAAAVPSGGLTLLGALVAAIGGVRGIADYRQQCRENPGHFLWKLQEQTKMAKPRIATNSGCQ